MELVCAAPRLAAVAPAPVGGARTIEPGYAEAVGRYLESVREGRIVWKKAPRRTQENPCRALGRGGSQSHVCEGYIAGRVDAVGETVYAEKVERDGPVWREAALFLRHGPVRVVGTVTWGTSTLPSPAWPSPFRWRAAARCGTAPKASALKMLPGDELCPTA